MIWDAPLDRIVSERLCVTLASSQLYPQALRKGIEETAIIQMLFTASIFHPLQGGVLFAVQILLQKLLTLSAAKAGL